MPIGLTVSLPIRKICCPIVVLVCAAVEFLLFPNTANAISFVNDYPDLNAKPYNISAYQWWGDENVNGKTDTPDELMSVRLYYYRNCTDGVAYWVKKYTGVDVAGWHNAIYWDSNASSAGYEVYTGDTKYIEAGDIAQSDDGVGHVGFVVNVNKDSNGIVKSFVAAELNKSGDGNYSYTEYSSKNANANFIRYGSYDWDHFIDVNGLGNGLYDESFGQSNSSLSGLNDVLDTTGDPELGWRTKNDGRSGWDYEYLDSTRSKVSLLLGDFDNDKQLNDVLDTPGDSSLGWRVSKKSKSNWDYNYLNSSRAANTMIVGDYDNDGFMDDILDTPGDSSIGWRVSKNGNEAWNDAYLNTSRQKNTLLVGDFDQDGFIDDLLDTTGDPSLGWRVSLNGKSTWDYSFMNSSRSADNMFVGDFDEDGFVDDVIDTGSEYGWRVSIDGRSAWDDSFRSSTMSASELTVGDFDDDGYLDDMFDAAGSGVGWRVSYNAKSSWDNSYSDSSRTMDTLIVGDFGD